MLQATLFTPKREPSTFSPAAAAACTPVWPADIMALQVGVSQTGAFAASAAACTIPDSSWHVTQAYATIPHQESVTHVSPRCLTCCRATP